MSEQTAEDIVLQEYPRAKAWQAGADEWFISDAAEDEDYGHGETELSAWDDAASKIPSRKRRLIAEGKLEPRTVKEDLTVTTGKESLQVGQEIGPNYTKAAEESELQWNGVGNPNNAENWERVPLTPAVAESYTWVPVYVERAICDLIPDEIGREVARVGWQWDDEHPGHKNALNRWKNEAIRQRRDLIALQAQMEMEKGEAEPLSAAPALEGGEDGFEEWWDKHTKHAGDLTLTEPYYAARAGWKARAALASKAEGEKCVDCLDYEENIRKWINQTGGNADTAHLSDELQSRLDQTGDVLGRICVLGTLAEGEKVHPSMETCEIGQHAAVRAILNQIKRAEKAEEASKAEGDQSVDVHEMVPPRSLAGKGDEGWNDALETVVARLQKDGAEDDEGNINLADTIDRIKALARLPPTPDAPASESRKGEM